MVSFVCAIIALILGYLLYGAFVERTFGVDESRLTPAYTKQDGIDFIPMPLWKVFLIQFLNIAGTGPIFGAISGVLFGPAAYLWIVFGCIFIGAMHDFTSGIISMRRSGASWSEFVGQEMGHTVHFVVRIYAIVMLVMVGAVFVTTPAGLLEGLTPTDGFLGSKLFWCCLIFIYYLMATLLPIDALIGKIYPLFGVALLIMAFGIGIGIFTHTGAMPELNEAFYSHHPAKLSIFPFMFITIACGAISGFHATQTPMMARCLKNEKYARFAFYGAMIAEGLVAIVWAAAAIKYANGSSENLAQTMNGNPAVIVNFICNDWMGRIGGVLAILGVVAAPITTGDTAFRSARLMTSEIFNISQKKIWQRLAVSIPLFACSCLLLTMDFSILWRYFGWMNQTMAIFTLWAITIYWYRHRKKYWYFISLIPSLFMTVTCSAYIIVAPEGFALQNKVLVACICAVITVLVLIGGISRMRLRRRQMDETRQTIDKSVEIYKKRSGYSVFEAKAFLFDMDGVLFDSMPYHAKAWKQALANVGVTFDERMVYLNEGRTGKSTVNTAFAEQLHREATDEEIEQIYKDKAEIFKSLYQPKPMLYALDILNTLANLGKKIILVTGSGQRSLLEQLNEYYPNLFTEANMVTSFDVKHGKPNPEPYLMGLEKAGVQPNEAVVIENAPLGVQSGVAANIFTVAVNTGILEDKELMESGADIVLPSMKQLFKNLPRLVEYA